MGMGYRWLLRESWDFYLMWINGVVFRNWVIWGVFNLEVFLGLRGGVFEEGEVDF